MLFVFWSAATYAASKVGRVVAGGESIIFAETAAKS